MSTFSSSDIPPSHGANGTPAGAASDAGTGRIGGTGRTPVQVVALIFGVVFLLVGIAGFVPGLTTQYDEMGFAGRRSMAMLLGLFMVSGLHNIVHLLYGLAGLAAARTWRASRLYLVVGGVVYLVL